MTDYTSYSGKPSIPIIPLALLSIGCSEDFEPGVGEFYMAEVTEALDYDLICKII